MIKRFIKKEINEEGRTHKRTSARACVCVYTNQHQQLSDDDDEDASFL